MSFTSRLSLLFVFLWSTAFIAFELCSTYAEPATFFLLRLTLAVMVLLVIMRVCKLAWPARWGLVFHSAVVGVLMHGFYGTGSYASIYYGMDVGFCALILSLQPIVTALLSSIFLGEKITANKVVGFVAGTTGVALVVSQAATTQIPIAQLGVHVATETNNLPYVLCVLALAAISIATIYQKRFCSNTPLVSGAIIQFSAAAIFLLPFAVLFETMQIDWSVSFVFGLGWLVFFISLGAMFLLMMLIKSQESSSVANLFYLVTPMVAVQAWILFDETLSVISILGMLSCMAGVAVVNCEATVFVKKAIGAASDDFQKQQTASNG